MKNVQYKLWYRLITNNQLSELITEVFDDLATARAARKINQLRHRILWSYITKIEQK